MTDTVNLVKGQNVNLTKGTTATKFVIGLGWDPEPSSSPDLDAAAYPCKTGADGKLHLVSPQNKQFVYYGNLTSADDAIHHSGDNLTGDGDGDDERITIDTSKLASDCDTITIAVAIYLASQRRQTFGLVRNAYVRIYEADALAAAEQGGKVLSDAQLNNLAVAKYDLQEDAGQFTMFEFGDVYKKDGEWKFRATGKGSMGDLGTLLGTVSDLAVRR